ncbi:MAG: hypothetical protein HYY08_01820 [Firmicutes bacterium]|nr:hypothetical protein [Bacillota bacterium]
MGRVRCPFCGAHNRFEAADLDRTMRCPCGARFALEPLSAFDEEFSGDLGSEETARAAPYIEEDGTSHSVTFY